MEFQAIPQPESLPADGLLRECTDTRHISQILDRFAATIAAEIADARLDAQKGSRASHKGAVAAPPSTPPPEPQLLRECTDPRPVSDILAAFAANIGEDPDVSAAERWGDKVGYSIFDEEELFGRVVDEDEDEGDDIDYDDDDDDYYTDTEGSDWESESEPEDLYNWPIGSGMHNLGDQNCYVPRAVKLIEPLCCVYTLERCLPDRCAICLDALTCGQGAWRLPCTHTFHDTCSMRFFAARRVRAACPVCRRDIKRFDAELPATA